MNNIIHADCIEVMKTMADKSVDCIVTDPPYGVGIDFGDYKDTTQNLRHLIATALPEMLRVAKVVAFTPGVANVHLYPPSTWILAWVYGSPRRYRWGFNHWQPILVYGD